MVGSHKPSVLDGVRINEPDASQVQFDLIPLDDVERLEVIRGPGGPFGRNTLAGAVNVTTRRGGGPLAGELEVGGGSFGRFDGRGTLSGSGGPWDFYLSGRYHDSEGWRRPPTPGSARFSNSDPEGSTYAWLS